MSNVIKYWKNEKKKKKNDGRMNENNRQSMPILRKKVVSLPLGFAFVRRCSCLVYFRCH